jgi:hypothetical protein
MKLARSVVAVALLSLALAAGAQVHHRRHHHHNTRVHAPVVPQNAAQLTTMQTDLKAAIASMKSSLPIYKGYETKSIHAATQALGIVNTVISGHSTVSNPAAVDPNQKASSKTKHKYSSSEVSTSQDSLRAGMASLQDAGSAYQAAMKMQTTSKRSRKLASLIRTAMNDATKAYNMQAGH